MLFSELGLGIWFVASMNMGSFMSQMPKSRYSAAFQQMSFLRLTSLVYNVVESEVMGSSLETNAKPSPVFSDTTILAGKYSLDV